MIHYNIIGDGMRGQYTDTKAGVPRGYDSGRPPQAGPDGYRIGRIDGPRGKRGGGRADHVQPYRKAYHQPAACDRESRKGGYQQERLTEEQREKRRAAQKKYEREIAQRRKALRKNRREKARWQQRRVLSLTNLLLALIGFLFIVSFSVVLVLNLRTLYYYDIQAQELVQKTGMSAETIRENYDVLIDYNLITKRVERLEFPDFPMSRHGEIHFREVKRIFILLQAFCAVSGVTAALWLARKLLYRDYGSLKLMSIFTVLIPSVLAALAIWNWEGVFTQFHELFFDNDYWLFDPVTDPVINILPDAFFLHCLGAVIFFVLLGGLLTGAAYRFATRKYRRRDERGNRI